MDLSGSIPRAVNEPSVAEARAALGAARAIAASSGRAARSTPTRTGMVAWGGAWFFGYLAVQFLPFPLGWVAWGPLSIAAHLLARRGRGATIRSGWEARFARSWWATIGGMLAVMFLVGPTAPAVIILLPGALWALAMGQYAIIADDRALGALAVAILVAAILARYLAPDWAALTLAIVGGGGMLALGLTRSWRPWR